MYIDISFTPGDTAEILDEHELEEALNQKQISHEDYNLALSTSYKIYKEITKHDNYIINNYQKYLNDIRKVKEA